MQKDPHSDNSYTLPGTVQSSGGKTPVGFVQLSALPSGELIALSVNDAFCRLRGMSREDILADGSNTAANAVHPDDMERLRGMIREILQSGEARSGRHRLLHASGEYRPYAVLGFAVENGENGALINAYYTDISDSEKRDLSANELVPYLLSAIMQYSTDLVFAKDRDFRYICCSPAFVRFTRRQTDAEVIGKTDYDLWTKEEADHFRADDEFLFTSGEPLIDYVEPIPSDDGVQHYCSTSKYLLRDAAGAVIGMYGIGRDITEYRTTYERLQLLTDSIPGGLATYMLSGSGSVEVTPKS